MNSRLLSSVLLEYAPILLCIDQTRGNDLPLSPLRGPKSETQLYCTVLPTKKMCENNFLSIIGGICLWSRVTDSLPNRRMFLPTATNDQQQFRRLLAYRTRMAEPSWLVQDSVIHHSSQWISISFPKYFFLLGKHVISFTLFGWRSIPVILFFCGLSELRDTAKPLGFTALQC